MTREKKEIIKKIDEIETEIRTDEELSCGFAPAGAYDEMYSLIYTLENKLAKLRGFNSWDDWFMHYSNQIADANLPFN
jgi:hypothetical protein